MDELTLEERRLDFGRKLKAIRQEKGISVEDLVHLTRIAPTFVDAIECGRFDLLPGGVVFGRGFMKNICKALDENPKDWIDLYDRCWPQIKKTSKKKNFGNFDHKSDGYSLSFFKKPLFWMTILTGLSGLFILSAWKRWMIHSLTEDESLVVYEESRSFIWPVFDHLYPKISTKNSDIAFLFDLDFENLKPLPQGISLNFQVKSTVYITISLDGAPQQQQVYHKGTYEVSFNNYVDFYISDIQSVIIYFNGGVYENLSKFGKSRKLRFFKKNQQKIPH